MNLDALLSGYYKPYNEDAFTYYGFTVLHAELWCCRIFWCGNLNFIHSGSCVAHVSICYNVNNGYQKYLLILITTLPHALYALQTPTCCLLLVFALPLPSVVLVLQPPQSGTHSHLAFVTLPLPIPFIAFLKLTASSSHSVPPSDSPKCLRFGHWLTLCTLNIHLLTYLLSYFLTYPQTRRPYVNFRVRKSGNPVNKMPMLACVEFVCVFLLLSCCVWQTFLRCCYHTHFFTSWAGWLTTCMENLDMSGNLKHFREMSGMLLTVREMSEKKSCHGKVSQNCSLHKTQETINIKLNTLTCTHSVQIR